MNQTFKVQGMSCDHCARAVTQAVQDVDPGAKVTVDLTTGRVDVQSALQVREEIAQAIEEEGYKVAA